MSTHNLCFEQKCEKYQNFYLKTFKFLVMNFSIYLNLNRHVFVMSGARYYIQKIHGLINLLPNFFVPYLF